MTSDGDATVTVVQGLGHTGPAPRDEPSEEPPPRFLGRYVILDELGAGGMGQVFRAYDPQLDREVALKLLRRVTHDARARLLREAQAMAKLSHPNVLPVYDVATEGSRLFLAMELVRGRSMRQWLDAAPRSVAEVLEVLVPAGRGLAAAHDGGLVHRDFKPGNVLIGDDGRVRVMDFGLARGRQGDSDSIIDGRRSDVIHDGASGPASGTGTGFRLDASSSSIAGERVRANDTNDRLGSLTEDLTQMGTVVGTPTYMAPEQHLGRVVDHRSDQYAYCVTLWEGLYGVRPFTSEVADEWYRVKSSTRPQLDPARRVPRWLHAVVLRGLSPRPSERHPSMAVLLRTLTRGRKRQRWRYAAMTAGMLGLGGVAVGLGAAGDPALCSGAHDKLAGIWDDETAGVVERALLSTEVAYAPDTWDRIGPQLDDYAARWEAAHEDACEATHVRHEQPEALMDARMLCLDDRRRSLRALVRTLGEADASVVERAGAAVSALPTIEPCSDPDYVEAQVAPPQDPALVAEAERLEEELARLKALVDGGQAAKLEDDARAVVERAKALGHAPLEAKALLQLASIEGELGHYEVAEQHFEQTYFLAQREGLDTLQARAAILLLHLTSSSMGNPDQGERWERFARAALQRVHDPSVEAAYLSNAGLFASARGELDTAVERLERALALDEHELGAGHPTVASVLNNLALVREQQGRYDEALALHRRALSIRERAFGPEHPQVASSLLNLSNIEQTLAHDDEALAVQLRAHAIYERAYGPDHPRTAATLVNLGIIYDVMGRQELALETHLAALAVLDRVHGGQHPDVAGVLTNIGNGYKALGDPQRALEHYERALEILEKTVGPDDYAVSIVRANLGSLALDRGDVETAATQLGRAREIAVAMTGPRSTMVAALDSDRALIHVMRGELEPALALHREALDVRRELLGPRHPETAGSLQGIGEVLVAMGRPAEAIEPLEQSVEIFAEHEGYAEPWQQARFELARAWWEADEDRARARATALEARAALRTLSQSQRGRENLEEIDRWLATHGESASHRG